MQITVQILVHAKNKVDTQHTVSTGAGRSGNPLILKATKGVKYELRDNGIKFAPDQVLVKRKGDNLEINLDDDGEKNIDAEADIVIENYYTESNVELIGLAEDGKYYPYLPQEADPSLLVDSMPDGMFSYQSLGTESGFNPIWLLALAPLGFIGSGGGSGDDSENHDPQATNNFLTSIYEDIYPPSETGNVITDDDGLGVDSDPDGDTLTVTAIRLGSETESGTSGTVDGISKLKGTYGYLIIAADGTYTYIIDNESLSTQSLAANEIVTEIFTYTISDGNGGTDSAMLEIDIHGKNDAPVAVDDLAITDEDTPVTIDVLVNDSDIDDGDLLTITGVTQGSHGTVTIDPVTGNPVYTPEANWNGTDTFTYTISDGNGGTDTATVTMDVAPVDDFPLAVDDSFNATEDTPYNGNLAANDTPSGDGGNVWSKATDPANGIVTVNSDGTFTYTPNANYNGTDSFTYTITDADGDTSTATVTMDVAPVDDFPLAVDDSFNATEDTPYNGNLAANDTPSGDGGNVWSKATDPANGIVTVNSDGTFTYTPNANYNGTDSFTYTITDADGDTSTATVTMDVAPVDDDVTIIVTDENGIDGGDITVYEKALAMVGSDSALPTETTTGTFTVTASDGLAKITIDGNDVTVSQLENLSTTPIAPISVTNGELTITGYDSGTGIVSYSYTLTSPDTTTPHANDGTNTTTQNISLSATDIDGDVATGVIKVGIVDDVPNAPLHLITTNVPPVDTNLLIIVDLSYSMSLPSGVAGLTRLELQQIAILDMISQYDALGDVMVQIVTFSGEATVHGTTWMTIDEAKAIVLGLVVDNMTDYDAALAGAIDGFDNPGKIPDAQNISYFFSDGTPTEGDESTGIVGDEVTAWTDFLTANHIKSYAIGLGTGVEDTDLNPIAYDGINNTEMDAMIVTDLSALMSTISATITPPPYISDLSGNTSDIHNFGADGGYISNITFDGISYAYDGVGALTTTGSGYTFDAITHVLTQTTASGSTIELDMDDGTYYYTTPAIVVVAYDDHFDYSITDFDGDISTNTVDIHVNSTLPPADLIINGTSGADMLAGEKGNDIINGLGGNDVLYGDGGNDIITGGDGDDNLLGSDGDDILSGDAGDDYLYGDIGDDILISDLRTIDVAVAGDTNLGSVDGGAGFDTFRMSGDGTVINFDVWSGTDSVLKNIEVIDLGAGGTSDNHDLTNITYSDVVNMTDSDNDLYILGDTEDNVTFSGAGWSQSAGTVTEIVNGASHTFYTWTNSSDPTVMVKVESVI